MSQDEKKSLEGMLASEHMTFSGFHQLSICFFLQGFLPFMPSQQCVLKDSTLF